MLANTNRSLTKRNPLEVPRDPVPARYTCRVYRVGDIEPFFTMVGQPGHLSRWSAKQAVIADYFQCDTDDVTTRELTDDGVELILVCGNVVGSFDRPVELRELLEESAALTDGSR